MATQKPVCRDVQAYLKFHLGKNWSAPLTGTDWRAFAAFCHLVDLWCTTESPHAEEAMRQTLKVCQSSVLPIFYHAAAGITMESTAERLWPRIKPKE